jgi:hypothetical protein
MLRKIYMVQPSETPIAEGRLKEAYLLDVIIEEISL